MKSFEAKSRQRYSSGLLVSGLLVGISFLVMLIPLALYHLAQVAATLRVKAAMKLLAAVIGLFLLGAIFLREPLLIVGSMIALFWTPFFAIGLFQREGRRPFGMSAFLFAIPVFLAGAFVFIIPLVPDFAVFFDSQRDLALARVLEQGVPQGTTPAEYEKFFHENFDRFKSTVEFQQISKFVALSGWQRLVWLVFDQGVAYFVGLILICLANLIFLDLAFEQVERLRAVGRYVLNHQGSFPGEMVQVVGSSAVMVQHDNSLDENIKVLGTEKSRGRENEEGSELASIFFKPKPFSNRIEVFGLRFQIERVWKGWGLKVLQIPLPFVAFAIVFLLSVVGFFKDLPKLVEVAQGPYGWILGLGGALTLTTLCIVSVQGVLVLHARLASWLFFASMLLLISFGAFVPVKPYLFLGIFGTLGLLDYVYDFRGKLNIEKGK